MAKAPASRQSVERILQEWLAINSELLGFYNANKDRAILVNSFAISKGPAYFIDLARERLGADLDSTLMKNQNAQDNAVPYLFASLLVEGALDAQALCLELESVADMPGVTRQEPKTLVYTAWDQYRSSQAQLEQMMTASRKFRAERDKQNKIFRYSQSTILRLRQKRTKQKRKNKKLQNIISKMLIEVNEYKRDSLSKEQEQMNGRHLDHGSLSAKVDELGKENELLQLQLHQVQEELQNYFLK